MCGGVVVFFLCGLVWFGYCFSWFWKSPGGGGGRKLAPGGGVQVLCRQQRSQHDLSAKKGCVFLSKSTVPRPFPTPFRPILPPPRAMHTACPSRETRTGGKAAERFEGKNKGTINHNLRGRKRGVGWVAEERKINVSRLCSSFFLERFTRAPSNVVLAHEIVLGFDCSGMNTVVVVVAVVVFFFFVFLCFFRGFTFRLEEEGVSYYFFLVCVFLLGEVKKITLCFWLLFLLLFFCVFFVLGQPIVALDSRGALPFCEEKGGSKLRGCGGKEKGRPLCALFLSSPLTQRTPGT